MISSTDMSAYERLLAKLVLSCLVKRLMGSIIYRVGTADLGVKMEKFSGVIKGRFYMTTSLSDSWEAFTPLHAGATLGRFLH